MNRCVFGLRQELKPSKLQLNGFGVIIDQYFIHFLMNFQMHFEIFIAKYESKC